MDNRFEIFQKNFKWVYTHFNGTYDMKSDPELFADTLKAYYENSKSIPTDKIYDFCKYIARQEKWPLIIQWYSISQSFIKDPNLETPKQQKTKKEETEIALQLDIVAGFWPLFSTLYGRTLVARIYAYTCYKNGLDMPNYWKNYLVYAPLTELNSEYFIHKPFTKKELRIMGMMIDNNNKDQKGRPSTFGRKVGSISHGFFARGYKKRSRK